MQNQPACAGAFAATFTGKPGFGKPGFTGWHGASGAGGSAGTGSGGTGLTLDSAARACIGGAGLSSAGSDTDPVGGSTGRARGAGCMDDSRIGSKGTGWGNADPEDGGDGGADGDTDPG
jgi:hypothetical protein